MIPRPHAQPNEELRKPRASGDDPDEIIPIRLIDL